MAARPPIIKHVAAFSRRSWRQIGFSWLHGRTKVYETTLTQDLIFWIYEQAVDTKLPFELWESRDEQTNGDDLEIAVETPDGYLLFPCQAKMINQSHQYPKLHYRSQGRSQLESLLEFAWLNGGMPIYLLYNCCFDRDHLYDHWKGNHRSVMALGCSVVPAAFLDQEYAQPGKMGIPTFQQLHPSIGIPLHVFLLELISGKNFSHAAWNFYCNDQPMKLFSYDDLNDPTQWHNLTPPPHLSGIPLTEEMIVGPKDDITEAFRPSFRLVFNLKKRLATIRRLG